MAWAAGRSSRWHWRRATARRSTGISKPIRYIPPGARNRRRPNIPTSGQRGQLQLGIGGRKAPSGSGVAFSTSRRRRSHRPGLSAARLSSASGSAPAAFGNLADHLGGQLPFWSPRPSGQHLFKDRTLRSGAMAASGLMCHPPCRQGRLQGGRVKPPNRCPKHHAALSVGVTHSSVQVAPSVEAVTMATLPSDITPPATAVSC